ncbi:MAG: NADH-quinone oxidoreductase subunit C [Emcibacteraceae bacterium]|nr:NADH-quinone oxidoreductase subunit C [Emcibacteraceae bacterium]
MSSDDALKDLGEHIKRHNADDVLDVKVAYNELTLNVERDNIVKIMTFLRDDPTCRFVQLSTVCGVDYPQREERFEVVYHLLSLHNNQRIRVKLTTDEESAVPSVVGVYPSANWYERETWDMYGIMFAGHPDLRRLLSDYGFQGHPLRKDFPLTGYVEVRYSEEEKRVVYEPVKLTQEFRTFDFMSPWEGAKYILPVDEKVEEGGES